MKRRHVDGGDGCVIPKGLRQLVPIVIDVISKSLEQARFLVNCHVKDLMRAVRVGISVTGIQAEIDPIMCLGVDAKPGTSYLPSPRQLLSCKVGRWESNRAAAGATRHSPGRLGAPL